MDFFSLRQARDTFAREQIACKTGVIISNFSVERRQARGDRGKRDTRDGGTRRKNKPLNNDNTPKVISENETC